MVPQRCAWWQAVAEKLNGSLEELLGFYPSFFPGSSNCGGLLPRSDGYSERPSPIPPPSHLPRTIFFCRRNDFRWLEKPWRVVMLQRHC